MSCISARRVFRFLAPSLYAIHVLVPVACVSTAVGMLELLREQALHF
jgi:hypothetical protein